MNEPSLTQYPRTLMIGLTREEHERLREALHAAIIELEDNPSRETYYAQAAAELNKLVLKLERAWAQAARAEGAAW